MGYKTYSKSIVSDKSLDRLDYAQNFGGFL